MEFHQFKSIFGYIEAKSQHVCKIQLKKWAHLSSFQQNSIQTFIHFSVFQRTQFKHLFNFHFSTKFN